MSYEFYFDKIRLPVTPPKLQVKIKGKNNAVTLINDGEINILKKAGLMEITFTAVFPNTKYPFAYYDGEFKKASFFLGELERLKTRTDNDGNLLPFQFIVARAFPGGRTEVNADNEENPFTVNDKSLFGTNIKVALEDYKINEDAQDGFDVSVDISLRQYKTYGTKTLEVTQEQTATAEQQRPAENPPTTATYTVSEGDTLPGIAQKQLGNGGRYQEIYNKNKDTIDAGNKGTGNTKYTVHAGQVLLIP